MDHGANDDTRQFLIDRERRRLRYKRNRKFQSVLFPLISAIYNCEYYHGTLDDIWNMKVFAFYDSVKRIQKIQESRALTAGIYAGTVDSKKVEKESLNWFGDYT